ncbi:hypothetical protein GCM10023093_22560 [Nemorincola caseinilytica]|uniref:Uncharacterized protein n=1 Tax=Nemorincola caseinilytica TaxID=2054315 RepID=A0ABP8NK07_9BACT
MLRRAHYMICLCMMLAWARPGSVYAQAQPVPDSLSVFSQPISLDPVMIKSSFDVNAFIRRVKNDTTFYKAFRSMHLVPYTSVNDIAVYDKKGRVTASQHSKARQDIENNCRTMTFTEQRTTGDYYKKNGENNYYTTALFDYLFVTKGKVCNEDDIVAGKMHAYGEGRMEKSKYELKQLIFNPGSKVAGIPFMADRASIFDEDEARKYDFKISQVALDGVDCYMFRITPKKGYERKVIYNELTTWFRRSDHTILARDHSLSYSTLVYDFDVTMKVRTVQIGEKIYPSYISYNGDWHIFTKKRERVKFTVGISY